MAGRQMHMHTFGVIHVFCGENRGCRFSCVQPAAPDSGISVDAGEDPVCRKRRAAVFDGQIQNGHSGVRGVFVCGHIGRYQTVFQFG